MRKSSPTAAASMLGFAIVMSPFADLQATELKILAGGSMTGSLNELGPQFERASGHKLTIHFDSTPNLIKQAASGEPFDLAVVPVPRRLWRYRPCRHSQTRRQHARCAKADAAQRAIHHLSAGERCRCLRLERVFASRH